MTELAFTVLLAFFAIAPVFDGLVLALLIRAYRKEHNAAILERLISAGSLFVSTLLISFLAVNRLFNLHLADDDAIAFLVGSLALVSVPSINWLYMYFTGRF